METIALLLAAIKHFRHRRIRFKGSDVYRFFKQRIIILEALRSIFYDKFEGADFSVGGLARFSEKSHTKEIAIYLNTRRASSIA